MCYYPDSYELADKDTVEGARKQLVRAIDGFAKDISSKYISVPHTTDFAIMFLPVEGLFAEVLREPGIMETLRLINPLVTTFRSLSQDFTFDNSFFEFNNDDLAILNSLKFAQS